MSKYKDNLSDGGGFPQGDPYTGGGSGGRQFVPPPAPGPRPAGATKPDPFNGPGSIDFNLMEPGKSLQEAGDTTQDIFTGLKAFVFGTDAPDAKGNHGGLPILGWGPIGTIGRFGSEVIANTAGQVVAAAAGAATGVLERTGPTDSSITQEEIQKQFDALPDGPAKQEALARIEADKGFLGTGGFTAHAHYMAEAIQKYEQEERISKDPSLWDGAFRPTASYMDAITNLVSGMGVFVKPVAEKWAGMGTPGQAGMNRVQMIMAVGDGHAVFNKDEGILGTGILAGDPTQGLNPTEQIVYDMVSKGAWDHADAQTFLASRGAAFSHAAAANIAGEVALDPLNLATMGAGTIAKVGATGAKLVTYLDDAKALLKVARAAEAAGEAGAAEKVAAAEKAVAELSKGVRTGSRAAATGSRDVLGRLAGREEVGDLFRAAGRGYKSLEGTNFGKAAKITRTVIDPLHAVGANPKAAASLDEGSREVTRAVAAAHGEIHHLNTYEALAAIPGAGSDIADQYLQGLAIYSGNVFRRVAGRSYRASQMMMSDKGEKLIETLPFESLRAAVGGMKRKASIQLTEEAAQFVKKTWSADEDLDLATRLASMWGGREAKDWLADLAKMNGEQKSLLHAATYGSGVKQLHEAIAAVKAMGGLGADGWTEGQLDRLILLKRGTLTTVGRDGILKRLEEAGSIDEKMAVIEDARRTYPHLRTYVVDDTSGAATVDNFIEMLERIKNQLPGQVRDEERAVMDGPLAAFDRLITPSSDPLTATFTLGFRPKDEFLWGLERDSDGVLREVGDPWMDQTSDIAGAYRPVREVSYNVAGKPIIGGAAVKGARLLDRAEVIGRMAMQGTTGKMVTMAARNKFIERVSTRYVLEDGTPALTETQVGAIWKALMDKVEESENISGVRGLSEGAIWKATKGKGVIPRYAERAGMDPRSLLVDILEAYDGDIRTIGLTQKLSGRVKAMLGKTFVGNTAGVISEHAWPLLKFKLNPFFQLQEKIEPWVLNAQRGASIALGTKPNAMDRAAMDLYTNFAEKNLIHIADNDIAELSGRFALGKALNRAMYGENAPMRGWAKKLEGMTDVQGTKQLNMMRTWRKGLGKSMRAEWEAHMPGEFDLMLRHHIATTGDIIDEDDFAVLMAHQNLAANGVFTKVIDGVPHMDYSNAILEAQWAAPQHLGEMRPLNLDYMAARLNLTDNTGQDLLTSMDLRRALADGRITHQDIARELRSLGAHKDYIQRVESALRFSWPEFWSEVKAAFSLTDAETTKFQNLFANIARQREMTPTEYMSQVYAPHVARGTEGSIGSMGALVDMARGGRTEALPDLAQLRGIDGQTGIRELYQQFGQVFSAHLDPSAKRNLLRELVDTGDAPDSISEILEVWDKTNATELLMDRIMNYIQGTPGTGAHTLVADEATGIDTIRALASDIRTADGRPRNLQRAVYENDPDLARRIAQAYRDMPEGNHIATPAELAERVTGDELRARSEVSSFINGQPNIAPLHARPGRDQMSDSLIAQYDRQAAEARRLYKRITDPTSQGGLGIKVTTVKSQTPYASADALRADLARGRLKVPRDGYWHPSFDATDAAIQRAVADVFGYGQEATQFGSHDAIMSAAAMYSDEARPTYLTDSFGASSWEEFSDEVIEQAVEMPTTVAEYEVRHGRAAPKRVTQPKSNRMSRSGFFSRSVGDGVKALPEKVQKELISIISGLRYEFPDVPFGRIDVADLSSSGAHAATMVWPQEVSTIVVSPHSGWQADDLERAARRLARKEQQAAAIRNAEMGGEVPFLVSNTTQGDLYHEWGHVVDNFLHYEGGRVNGGVRRSVYHDQALTDFMARWRNNGNASRLSRYGGEANQHQMLTDSESFGELFDAAFNPEHMDDLEAMRLDPVGAELYENIMEFRDHLKRLKVWKPEGPGPVAVNPHAGKTVAEANAAGAAIRAPRRVGVLPQDLADELTEKFLGNGRYAESNPDIARVAGFMRDYMREATSHTMEHGTASQYARLFDGMSGMPVSDPVPFNVTEAALWHGQAQMMAAKWQDAFRLQYFAQNRSVLQRSLNHPMFGLYPASYMWGKVGPEMVKFMALEPFGAKTGLMAYTLLDIQKAVAVQRQFDPEFDKKIEEMGHSAALSWLGYMLPATPWSVPASYPAWMRDMANQGLANKALAEAGQEVNDTDFITPLNATLKKVQPLTTQLPFFGRALDEVNAGLPWNAEEEALPPVQYPNAGLPAAEPLVPQNAPVPQGAEQDPLAEPVTGLDTENVLKQAMDNLSAMLGQ